ncbi:MAG TPA: flippase [Candidatus Omnitrophica bacterium]|nr:MAG: O-unit flippase [Omnitrophica WOR_2 bacterium GWA2_45_18]HBR14290.1 flippase [Candidatus Omnitrophota bacterium]
MRRLLDILFDGVKIKNSPNPLRILKNISWLFVDNIFRMGVGLFIVAWIARYLGPEQYGLWNYAIAFTVLFTAFATLGLNNIVVREIVKRPDQKDEILGSAFILKFLGGLLTLILTVTIIYFLRDGDIQTMWLVGLSAAGFVFQSFNVIEFYFQSQLKSKYAVYAQNGSFLLFIFVKISLLLAHVTLIAFAIAGFVETAMGALLLAIVYKYTKHSIFSWRFRMDKARALLRDSWPLLLSSIAVMIYMRIDQIMLGQMMGDEAVGIYSAAVRISEAWYFIPVAIVNSVFPVIIQTKSVDETLYRRRLQKLFDAMALLGIIVAVVATIVSEKFVQFLYGADYVASAGVLVLHIWGGIFVCLGVASGNWFTTENLQKYTFYRTAAGGVMNIGLNLHLIPVYGVNGAALATVISQGLACYLFNVLNKRTRELFFMQTRSLFLLNFGWPRLG